MKKRMRPVHWSGLVLCVPFIALTLTVEIQPVKTPISLIREVLFWNKWSRKTWGGTGWLRCSWKINWLFVFFLEVVIVLLCINVVVTFYCYETTTTSYLFFVYVAGLFWSHFGFERVPQTEPLGIAGVGFWHLWVGCPSCHPTNRSKHSRELEATTQTMEDRPLDLILCWSTEWLPTEWTLQPLRWLSNASMLPCQGNNNLAMKFHSHLHPNFTPKIHEK